MPSINRHMPTTVQSTQCVRVAWAQGLLNVGCEP